MIAAIAEHWKMSEMPGFSLLCMTSRCEVGTKHWAQCNETPVKYARFPVTGLVEGRTYVFRVRAINIAGVSRASRISDPVVAMDPSDRARLKGTFTNIISYVWENKHLY